MRTITEFAGRVEDALGGEPTPQAPRSRKRRSRRRAAPVLGPFDAYESGEEALVQALDGLDVEQLKDIVAHHGIDQQRLAMKWRSKDRLVELVATRVKERAHKGEVFME